MQLEFSRDDEFLGSVGRDRLFCLFKKSLSDPKHPYQLFFQNQSHTRVIYTLNFTPDSHFCLTGSRDKKLKIWTLSEQPKQFQEHKLHDSITAISTTIHKPASSSYIIALGFENGEIQLGLFDEGKFQLTFKIPKNIGHSLQINRLLFK